MKIDKNGKPVGTAGSLTHRTVKGETVVSVKIHHTRQTKSTKKAGTVFGLSSTTTSMIVDGMNHIVKGQWDDTMWDRIKSEMAYIFAHCYDRKKNAVEFESDSFQRLQGFNFNLKFPVKNTLWKYPIVQFADEDQIVVTIPALRLPKDLIFPKDSDNCELELVFNQFALIGSHMDRPIILKKEIILGSGQSEDQEFRFQTYPGCLCIIGMTLRFYKYEGIYKTKYNQDDLLSSQILEATVIPGTFELPASKENGTTTWSETELEIKNKILN